MDLETDCSQNLIHKKRAIWVKVGTFIGAAAGTGVVGFISATGGVYWIAESMNLPGVVTLFLLAFFLFVLLGWKLAWRIVKLDKVSNASWLSILSLFVWIFLSFGVIWTGFLTGGVLPGGADRIMNSLFDELFGSKTADITDISDFILASGLYWGALLFAFIAAYWSAGRREDRWQTLANTFPKTSQFLALGYGVDSLMSRALWAVKWYGNFSENLIDRKIWNRWIPHGLSKGIKFFSEAISEFDVRLSSVLGTSLQKLVDIPAKVLQLIQTGDLQWYLVFALGSGFALLSHFLKI
jgi:hypothetical protein